MSPLQVSHPEGTVLELAPVMYEFADEIAQEHHENWVRCEAKKDDKRCVNSRTAPYAGPPHVFCSGPHRYE